MMLTSDTEEAVRLASPELLQSCSRVLRDVGRRNSCRLYTPAKFSSKTTFLITFLNRKSNKDAC